MHSQGRLKEFEEAVLFMDPTYRLPFKEPACPRSPPHQFSVAVRQINVTCKNISWNLDRFLAFIENKSIFTHNFDDCYNLVMFMEEELQNTENELLGLEVILKEQNFANQQSRQHCEGIKLHLRERYSRLSKRVKLFLENYWDILKDQHSRIKIFSDENIPVLLVPEDVDEDDSILLEDELNHSLPSTVSYAKLLRMDFTKANSRSGELYKIESTVGEVGEMLKTIAVAIERQKETIDIIESRIESTALDVESVYFKWMQYVRSKIVNQIFMIKVFAALLVTAILIAVVAV